MKRHSPRHGSLQFWPRKRAKREIPRIKAWSKLAGAKLLGFAGYKVGMAHVIMKDTSTKVTKGMDISTPVTIIECPPLKPLSLRLYKNTSYGLKVVSEIPVKNLNKELARKIKLPKKQSEKKETEFDELRLQVYTQPKLTAIGKKKPEIFEIALSGSKEEQLSIAKQFLEKEIKLSDVFKEGELVDVHAVTTGKGFQGTTKRFGTRLRQHKSEKVKRGVGSLGPWHSRSIWAVPHPGKMGYHTRLDFNKLILKVDSNPSAINPKQGFHKYGFVKNDYIILKGSVPGPKKRAIRFIEAIRPDKALKIIPEIKNIIIK